MPGGRPVAMTVEQRADNAATQHAIERLVLLARLPLSDDLIAIREAAHVQTLRIRRSTTKASEIRGVSFLNALHLICTWYLVFGSLYLGELRSKNKVQRTKY